MSTVNSLTAYAKENFSENKKHSNAEGEGAPSLCAESRANILSRRLLPGEKTSVPINTLEPHWVNRQIYGNDENVSDLEKIIGDSEWFKPLVVTPNRTIISGHHRWRAALRLGKTHLPVEVKVFADEQAELEAVLMDNAYRKKTLEQRIREAMCWGKIERQKARQRQREAARLMNKNRRVDESQGESHQIPEQAKGRTRDRLATRIGMKGRTFDKATKVIQCIDQALADGKQEMAEGLRIILNYKSVDAAYRLVRLDGEKRSKVLKEIAEAESSYTHGKRGDRVCFSCITIEPEESVMSTKALENTFNSNEKNRMMMNEAATNETDNPLKDVFERLDRLDATLLREAAGEFARDYTKYYCLGIIDHIQCFSTGQLAQVLKAISEHIPIEELQKLSR